MAMQPPARIDGVDLCRRICQAHVNEASEAEEVAISAAADEVPAAVSSSVMMDALLGVHGGQEHVCCEHARVGGQGDEDAVALSWAQIFEIWRVAGCTLSLFQECTYTTSWLPAVG